MCSTPQMSCWKNFRIKDSERGPEADLRRGTRGTAPWGGGEGSTFQIFFSASHFPESSGQSLSSPPPGEWDHCQLLRLTM